MIWLPAAAQGFSDAINLLRDRRSAWKCLSLITDASSFNEIPVPLQNGLVSRRIHIKFQFESTLHSHNIVLWNSSTHQLRCCEVSVILHFSALWRRAGKLKISWVNVSAVPYLYKYSSKFWFYNYLKSRSVFVFTLYNELCSLIKKKTPQAYKVSTNLNTFHNYMFQTRWFITGKCASIDIIHMLSHYWFLIPHTILFLIMKHSIYGEPPD